MDSFATPHAARHRAHDPAARRRDGHRRHPARRGVRDGAAGTARWRAWRRRWTWKRASRISTATDRVTSGRLGPSLLRCASRSRSTPTSSRPGSRAARWRASAGFHPRDRPSIATAISELARNILRYAARRRDHPRPRRTTAARDRGRRRRRRPGHPRRRPGDAGRLLDVGRARPRAARAPGGSMDEFEIASDFGKGTTVTVRRWKR